MTDDNNPEHDECDKCPKCGHESDMMGYWFRVGGPSSGGLAWACWECGTMLPSMAALQSRIQELEVELAKERGFDIDEGVPNCGWGS